MKIVTQLVKQYCLYLHFKSVLKKLKNFINFFLVFLYHFDALILKIFFLK
jgi:hypothetical protein